MIRRARNGLQRARPQVEMLEAKQLLATFLVSNTVDSGLGSLRKAIEEVNATPGTASQPDVITFAIPGSGVQTITPSTPLPVITTGAVVDGTTQPGYAGTPLIVIDGVNAAAPDGGPVNGLNFLSATGVDKFEARGLAIVRFSGNGVEADGAGEGVFTHLAIGTDKPGGQDLGNAGYGIKFGDYSLSNTVSNSVIAYNGSRAIGGSNDAPGQPTIDGSFTTQDVVEEHNNNRATRFDVTTTPAEDQHSPRYALLDSTATLTFVVTNTGPNTATDAVVALSEAPSIRYLTFVSATTSQGTVAAVPDTRSIAQLGSTTPSWLASGAPLAVAKLGSLAPGASATITLQVRDDDDQPDAPPAYVVATPTAPELDYAPSYTAGAIAIGFNTTGQAPPTLGGIQYDGDVPIPPPLAQAGMSYGNDVINVLPPIAPADLLPPVASADLVVATSAPAAPHVGAASLFVMTITNAGAATAGDAVAAVDMAGLPAGTFYSILSRTTRGGSGPLQPMPGRPGVYLVDLGPIAAGASAVVDVMVIPHTTGSLNLLIAAADATDPTADPNPGNNLALAHAAAIPVAATGTMTASNVVQLHFASPLTRAAAENSSHYQVTTGSGATVPVRSARYNAARRQVTLRLGQSIPAGASSAQLLITGLGTTPDEAATKLTLGRRHPAR